ncbi:DUF2177 family protein [Candidatus Babeliales bacterium]|nr:DUF2177 family protein [Candidatus Babeliales bacterium]
MKHFIKMSAVIFAVMLVVDGVWLSVMGPRFYKIYLKHLFAESFNYMWALLFYMLYACLVNYFVVQPAMQYDQSVLHTFLQGCFLGLVVYSAYDLTNQATLKNWPIIVTVVDMLWGSILTGSTAALVHAIVQKYHIVL